MLLEPTKLFQVYYDTHKTAHMLQQITSLSHGCQKGDSYPDILTGKLIELGYSNNLDNKEFFNLYYAHSLILCKKEINVGSNCHNLYYKL